MATRSRSSSSMPGLLLTALLVSAPLGLAVRAQAAETPVAGTVLAGRLAYVDPAGDLWVVDGDGAQRRRVTDSGAGADYDPSWAPDGTRFVFRTTRGSQVPVYAGGEGIFVVDANGAHETEIGPASGAGFPDWSPDGDTIALTAGIGPGWASLAVMAPDGSSLIDFGVAGEVPDWSPDGSRIAFSSPFAEPSSWEAARAQPYWELQFDVWIMDSDGTDLVRLTERAVNEYPVGWSPDGRWIVVETEGETGYRMVAVDGSRQARPLTSAAGVPVRQFLAWLPDGRLLFWSDPDPATGVFPWYVMNPDGTETTRLDSYPALRPADVMPFAHRMQVADWWSSP
ncbi:MAG: TolB family protein [Thermomicrobiales bacterium]